MSAPTPDLKPHVPPLPPGSECCGCCSGVEVETPREIDNRSGLSAIAYRVGDYGRFRDSLHARLSLSSIPQLANLRTRDEDDFTIALIDAFACAADVLTFYQERIANESYLRTAVERVSLQEMGKLIGYRLRPGVAAETWLALALETPPTPPGTLKPEPGNFVTGVPAARALETGLKVQSIPGPNEKPQIFETVEDLDEARPEWNAMQPWLTEVRRPGYGDTTAYLSGLRNSLKVGDALVFVGDEYLANTASDNWDFRILDSVVLDTGSDTTIVTWKRRLGSIQPFSNVAKQNPQVHALRKRASAFGHNAPMWASMPETFRDDYSKGVGGVGGIKAIKLMSPTADDDELQALWVDAAAILIGNDDWPQYVLSPKGQTSNGGFVDLDTVYPDVANGGYIVLATGGFNYASEPGPSNTYVELYSVANASEVSRAAFAMSGKVTRAQLNGENYALFKDKVRDTAIFAASEQLAFAEYPVVTEVSNELLPVNAPADGFVGGRRLIVRGNRVSDGETVVVQATLVAAHAIDSERCELEISPPLAEPLVRDTVIVYGNVVLASHGASVTQILGNGNAAGAFQRFELKQQPLTYRAAPNEIGAAPELTVRVGDIEWTERSSMFGATAADRAYMLSTDEKARNFVVFGDGIRGARLPSGVNNVHAQYRTGLGVDGNVDAEKLTQLLLPPLGVKSVSNPLAAEGGADPEQADDARQSMPLTTRTLGRAVSVLDYEDYARGYSGIAKAQARVLDLPGGRTVAITIAGPDGAPITAASPTWINLLGALRSNGDPHVPVALLGHQASTFHLGLRIKRDPAYDIKTVLASVEDTLRDQYSFAKRALSQPVQQSEVIAVVQGVPGVVAVDITRLYGGTRPPDQTVPGTAQVRLLASQMRVESGVAQPAELLTLDAAVFDQLEEMT